MALQDRNALLSLLKESIASLQQIEHNLQNNPDFIQACYESPHLSRLVARLYKKLVMIKKGRKVIQQEEAYQLIIKQINRLREIDALLHLKAIPKP